MQCVAIVAYRVKWLACSHNNRVRCCKHEMQARSKMETYVYTNKMICMVTTTVVQYPQVVQVAILYMACTHREYSNARVLARTCSRFQGHGCVQDIACQCPLVRYCPSTLFLDCQRVGTLAIVIRRGGDAKVARLTPWRAPTAHIEREIRGIVNTGAHVCMHHAASPDTCCARSSTRHRPPRPSPQCSQCG